MSLKIKICIECQQQISLSYSQFPGGALTIMKVDQNTDKGFYTCYVTSREGHVARKEIQLIVNAPPVMEPFNFPTSIQEGGRAQVTCTVTSGDLPIHFFWYKDEEPISASLEVRAFIFCSCNKTSLRK